VRGDVRRSGPFEGLAPQLREALAPLAPERVILFGSAARGETDRWSDLDVIVVMRSEKPFVERGREVMDRIHRVLGRHADALVYTPEEFEEMKGRGVGVVAKALEEGIVVV
jgi:predicted nucleotidyltransferase